MGESGEPIDWLRPRHADPQHPHCPGAGGDVVCLDRRCTGGLRQQRRERQQQSLATVWWFGLGGPGAAQLGHELLCGLKHRFKADTGCQYGRPES